MKKYEIKPIDSHKSFYGKAVVVEKDSGEKVLLSYDTEVCKITADGRFIRLWNGYSATTMRHINSFICLTGVSGNGGKAWWKSLPVEK